MEKSLTQQLLEAAEWCAGAQAHTPYSDVDYINLFRAAAAEIGHPTRVGDMVICDPSPHAAAGAPIITGKTYKL